MGIARIVSTLVAERTELVRVLLLVAVIKPLAVLRLFSVADAVARGSGFLFAVFTRCGRQAARDFRAAFSVSFGRALLMSARWNAVRQREFLCQQRVLLGYRPDQAHPIASENEARVRAWIAQKRSFVIALAHFGRDDAAYAVLSERSLPIPLKILASRGYEHPRTPREWRVTVQYEQIQRVLGTYQPYAREPAFIGEQLGISRSTLRHLSSPGGVLAVMVDSPWPSNKPSAFNRPFAGARSRTFASGVGFLARMAQCPVVLCLPVQRPDGSILVRWSDPIEPPAPEDTAGDRFVTNRLLDMIEIEVGRRPTEYLWPLGGERRWNPATECWIDLPSVDPNVAYVKLWSRSLG